MDHRHDEPPPAFWKSAAGVTLRVTRLVPEKVHVRKALAELLPRSAIRRRRLAMPGVGMRP